MIKLSLSLEILNNIATAIEAYNRPNNRIINMCIGGGLCTQDILAILRLDANYWKQRGQTFTFEDIKDTYTTIAIRIGYSIPSDAAFNNFVAQL